MMGGTRAPKCPIPMASGGCNLTSRAASVGMDSLAVMLLSVCSKPGGPSSLVSRW